MSKMERAAPSSAAIAGATTAVPYDASFLVARRSDEISRGLLRRKVVEHWQPLLLTRVTDGVPSQHFILEPLPAASTDSNSLTAVSTALSSVHDSVATNGNRTTTNGPELGIPWVCLNAQVLQGHQDAQSPALAPAAAAATPVTTATAARTTVVSAAATATATPPRIDFSLPLRHETKWRSASVQIEWCTATTWASSVRYGTALASPAPTALLYCNPADLTDLLAFLRGAVVLASRSGNQEEANPPLSASLLEQPRPNLLQASQKSTGSKKTSGIGLSSRSRDSTTKTNGAVDLFQPALEVLGTAKQLEASCEWASAATAYAQGADMLDNLAAGTSWRTISSRVSSGSDSSSSSSSSSAGIALDAKGRDIAAAQAAHFRAKAAKMHATAITTTPTTPTAATTAAEFEAALSSSSGGGAHDVASSGAAVAPPPPVTATAPAPAPVAAAAAATEVEASDAAVADLRARLRALKATEEEGVDSTGVVLPGATTMTTAPANAPCAPFAAASNEEALRLRLSALQQSSNDNNNPNSPPPTEEELAARMAALRGFNAAAAATPANLTNLSERYQSLTGHSWAGFGGASSNYMRGSGGSGNGNNDNVDEDTAVQQIVAAAEEFEALQRRDRSDDNGIITSNNLLNSLSGGGDTSPHGSIGNNGHIHHQQFNENGRGTADDGNTVAMDFEENAALMAMAFEGGAASTGSGMSSPEGTAGRLGQGECEEENVASLLVEAQAALAAVARNTASSNGGSGALNSRNSNTSSGVGGSGQNESGKFAEDGENGDAEEAAEAAEAAAVDHIVRAAQEQAVADAVLAKATAEAKAVTAANEAAAAAVLGMPLPPLAPERAPMPLAPLPPAGDTARQHKGGHAAADSVPDTRVGASRMKAKGSRRARGASVRRRSASDGGETSESDSRSSFSESESEESLDSE